jgi:hypothetical protein
VRGQLINPLPLILECEYEFSWNEMNRGNGFYNPEFKLEWKKVASCVKYDIISAKKRFVFHLEFIP